MAYIFISHVEEDSGLAEQIAVGVEAAGYTVWYYERDTLPGASYLEQVLSAIRSASAVVVIVSQASMGSWQVDKEVVQALEFGKPFMPLLRDVTHTGFRGRRPEWAMAMGAATSLAIPAIGPESIIPRLVAGLAHIGVPNAVSVPGGSSHPSSPVAPLAEDDSSGRGKVKPVDERNSKPNPRGLRERLTTPLRHSLWIAWTFTLFLNYIAFLWIGWRVRHMRWIIWGCIYGIPPIVLLIVGQINNVAHSWVDIAWIWVWVGSGVVAVIHAFRVRTEYIIRLEHRKRIEPLLRQQREMALRSSLESDSPEYSSRSEV